MDLVKKFINSKSFAVVGATDNEEKYGYKVYIRLKNYCSETYAVHPKLKEIKGAAVYSSLSALPKVPEAVNIIVSPAITEQVVEECHKLGIKKVWMQPGAESDKAVAFCKDNGIEVVFKDCVLSHLGFC